MKSNLLFVLHIIQNVLLLMLLIVAFWLLNASNIK